MLVGRAVGVMLRLVELLLLVLAVLLLLLLRVVVLLELLVLRLLSSVVLLRLVVVDVGGSVAGLNVGRIKREVAGVETKEGGPAFGKVATGRILQVSLACSRCRFRWKVRQSGSCCC